MSISISETLVKYGARIFNKYSPPDDYLSNQFGKAKSKFGENSKLFWRAGFFVRHGKAFHTAGSLWAVDKETVDLKQWSCSCPDGNQPTCEHRIAAAVLFRWQNLIRAVPSQDIVTWLALSIRGRAGVELTLRVKSNMRYSMGGPPSTVELFAYTLDGQTVDFSSVGSVVINYFDFHRIMQENGIHEGLSTQEAEATHYHLTYRGFHDLNTGNYLPKPAQRTQAGSDGLIATSTYWQTTHDLSTKFRSVPMTGAS